MRLVAVLCVIIAVLAAFPAVSTGADAKALLSEANTLFRSADKDFMSGKMDSAWETVAKAKEAITAAKEADPSNSQVASLEKRIDQLAVKIEKRRGGASQTAPAGKASGPSAAPKRLPATAGRYLMEAERALKRTEASSALTGTSRIPHGCPQGSGRPWPPPRKISESCWPNTRTSATTRTWPRRSNGWKQPGRSSRPWKKRRLHQRKPRRPPGPPGRRRAGNG